jgi:phosphatidylserine decarboxylase
MLETVDKFTNFNEFFYRKLKPSARPLASPSDPVRLSLSLSPPFFRFTVRRGGCVGVVHLTCATH